MECDTRKIFVGTRQSRGKYFNRAVLISYRAQIILDCFDFVVCALHEVTTVMVKYLSIYGHSSPNLL